MKIATTVQICLNIKNARITKKLSQQQVADLLEESRSTYAEWEKGTLPRVDIFFRIAEILEVSPYKLLDVDEKSFSGAELTNNNKTVITVEGTSESNYLNELLDEKEARRRDTEARLTKVDTVNDRLLNLLEINSNLSVKLQIATLSDLKASITYQAEKEAGGEKKKQILIESHVSKLAGEHQERIVSIYNPQGQDNPSKA
ncbi:helix-turn-helix domain-containing protein [Paraflavitalea pollutisoli]|uniref:helix-turn-helix domain-containing protein n=1 Tax=Paraflavitalea pollutisoli TaxID=3034143 RepID=UPI0023EDD596|nr:helix-turn-helix domain-containing protein [Paraflavitalea sp. H1-2-19X]